MKRIAIVLAMLGSTTVADAQILQPFDCPNVGDTCVVPYGNDFLDFNYPFGGYYADNVVLGKVTMSWGSVLVACVNNQILFSRDAYGFYRSTLTKNSVVCVGSGNDTVKVLAGTETQGCTFQGASFTMRAFAYGAYELAIYGQGGNDQITGGDGNDQICGASGSDRLWGRNGMNELNGGIGNDDIYGGPDIDWMYGGDGDDIVSDAAGNGGWRGACRTGGQNVPPPRIEGGTGNDCLQLASWINDPGWCYAQSEWCDGSATLPCHSGIYCGPGYDRIDTPGPDGGSGGACEVRTNGSACRR